MRLQVKTENVVSENRDRQAQACGRLQRFHYEMLCAHIYMCASVCECVRVRGNLYLYQQTGDREIIENGEVPRISVIFLLRTHHAARC
jgi:hypothetical protein